MQKTIPQLLAVVRALSDQRFLSYERFREKVTFQKREFAFSCFFCAFLWSRILLKLLLGVFVIILNILVKTRALLSRRFPSYERFREEVIFRKCKFAFSWIFLGYFVFELLPETAEYGFSNNFTLFGAN